MNRLTVLYWFIILIAYSGLSQLLFFMTRFDLLKILMLKLLNLPYISCLSEIRLDPNIILLVILKVNLFNIFYVSIIFTVPLDERVFINIAKLIIVWLVTLKFSKLLIRFVSKELIVIVLFISIIKIIIIKLI